MILSQFELYCNSHLWALAVFFFLGVVATKYSKLGNVNVVTRTVGLACLLSLPIQIVAYSATNFPFNIENYIPCHLCDVAAIITGVALLKRHTLLMELAYFWGLAGTLQGLLTPDLHFNFPHPIFISFFWLHGFVVLGAAILPLGLQWSPRKHAVLRSFLWLQVYVITAFCFNQALGTNFAFLSEKPEQGSLMDHFGPVPLHIISLECAALFLFSLLNLPFRIKRKITK